MPTFLDIREVYRREFGEKIKLEKVTHNLPAPLKTPVTYTPTVTVKTTNNHHN